MNLVQLKLSTGGRGVAAVEGDRLRLLDGVDSTRQLASQAIAAGGGLETAASARLGSRSVFYDAVIA